MFSAFHPKNTLLKQLKENVMPSVFYFILFILFCLKEDNSGMSVGPVWTVTYSRKNRFLLFSALMY
jgi:hypothetical protein